MPKLKKQRSSSGSVGGSRSSLVFRDVVDWLGKRKLDVPSALQAVCPSAAAEATREPRASADQSPEFQWAVSLLPALRERERRALARYVQQRGAASGGSGSATASAAAASAPADGCSDGEVDDGLPLAPPSVCGGRWPSDVTYSNDYVWLDDVPAPLRSGYQPEAWRRRAARPGRRTISAVVTEPHHPAAGQCGLFAAADLAHGTWVVDYVGAVSLGEHEDKTSDYVCDFGEHSELALDAQRVGNEGRFVNDYRNTGKHANVEFRLRRDRRGELRQGIFVCAKGGVREGEELLISYGKGYWRSRIEGSLEDFVYRLPGQEPPAAGTLRTH